MIDKNEIRSIRDVPGEECELLRGGAPPCAGCIGELGLKLALKALGPKTIVVNASGCMTLLCNWPYTPLKVSWLHNAIENAPASATGIWHALRKKEKDFTILCYAGDGATFDIGLQSLSAAIARNDPFVYVCYNNQGYANTGNQWATSTPLFAATRTTPPGKRSRGNAAPEKDIMRIVAAHGCYAATANAAFPLDYMNKLRKAAAMKAPTFINFFSACPTDWGYEPGLGIKLSRLAVECAFWPLYEIEKGKLTINYKPERLASVKPFLEEQERFRHLSAGDITEIQHGISWKWKALLREEEGSK